MDLQIGLTTIPLKRDQILCVAETRLHNRSITASDGQNGAKEKTTSHFASELEGKLR